MISILVPTYNRTELLMNRAIPSILAQTVTDWECHVIGDGTEQATVDAMAELCARDPRFRFTNLPHQQYSEDFHTRWGQIGLVSLNYGLDTAKGEWIAALADDDEWTPDCLEVLLNAALETGVDHVYGMSDTIKNGHVTFQLYGHWPPGYGAFCNGANLYRASLPYRYDLECVNRGLPGDGDMWNRMVAGGVSFHFVPRIVMHYHRNYP